MARAQSTVFVLWGRGFDELVACTFVTIFRRSGLRVKLVGISGSRNRGACGLSLLPDIALHEALPLASHAAAVVIPCEGGVLRRVVEDVQVITLLEQADAARFILQSPWPQELKPQLRDRYMTYLLDESLQIVVEELALLLNKT